MTQRHAAIVAWTLSALCIVSVVVQTTIALTTTSGPLSLFDMVERFGWRLLLPILFAVPAALIIARRQGNRVGWLLMLPALTVAIPGDTILVGLAGPPAEVTPTLFLLMWLDGWSWIPAIFPILLIPLHFPTGRPPAPRWRWVNRLAAGMWLFFILLSLFIESIGPINGAWTVPNPIGFISLETANSIFGVVWSIGLATIALSSIASLFVRYRRAGLIERQQIRWLLFAGAGFALFYSVSALFGTEESRSTGLANLLFVITLGMMPVSIAIAILRYRLYEIDIIIRRTLTYGLLSGLLALFYFGSILIMQTLAQRATGAQSPLIIVLSTLLIAALFTPLRRRVQQFINRRFFRRTYDAQQVLARFAQSARNEVELERLTAELVGW